MNEGVDCTNWEAMKTSFIEAFANLTETQLVSSIKVDKQSGHEDLKKGNFLGS